MAGNHQLSLGPMEGKAVTQPRGTDASAVEQLVPPDGGKDLFELVVDAICEDRTCLEKQAYLALGLPNAPYWSAVKAKERPAPRADKVTNLPTLTQRAACKRWAQQLGMHVTEETAQKRAALDLIKTAAAFLEVAK